MPTPAIVIQTESLAAAAAQWLGEHATVVQAAAGTEAFAHAAPHARGLVVRTYTRVDDALLAQIPALEIVGRAGVGLDNIDLGACRRRGVQVVYTPDANTQAVVEYVLCLLCDALRPRTLLREALTVDQWNQVRQDIVGTRQMNEVCIGVLGMGRIGRRVAQVAAAIGCRVAYCDIREIPENERFGATPVSVEHLFAASDVVTLHIDGRPGNRGYVNAALLGAMKPDAILLNTCRGMVLDTDALAATLRARPRMTAVLDVHEPEPVPASHPLLGLPNAHLAPHLASRTTTAMNAMSWVVRDVVAVLEGRMPQWPA